MLHLMHILESLRSWVKVIGHGAPDAHTGESLRSRFVRSGGARCRGRNIQENSGLWYRGGCGGDVGAGVSRWWVLDDWD